MPPRSTTPTRTRRSTLPDEPCFGAADGLLIGFAGAGRAGASGVVETLTRALPTDGTAGITTLDAGDFFTAFFAVDLFAVAFLVVDFFADAFFTGAFFAIFFVVAFFFATLFLAAVFFAGDFFAAFLGAAFFAVDFLGAAFFAALFFFTATVDLLELRIGGIWGKFNLGI